LYRNAFETAYRNVHSIKGSAGTHGLLALSSICHHFEDLLTRIDQESSAVSDEQIDVSLKYVDLLRDTASQLQTGNLDDDVLNEALAAQSNRIFPGEYTGLLVDGSKFNAKIILNALTELPVKLTVVNNGYEALERLLQEKFDFVITGKELPVLNGVALLSALRASETGNAGIKTVLVTSKDEMALPFPGLVDQIVKKDQNMLAALQEVVRKILSIE
jgi:CheY-like chemotaxis protein/HPt (histidine-containing phosphotransfer) domain-containing protein